MSVEKQFLIPCLLLTNSEGGCHVKIIDWVGDPSLGGSWLLPWECHEEEVGRMTHGQQKENFWFE
jgi:hypothetical protein